MNVWLKFRTETKFQKQQASGHHKMSTDKMFVFWLSLLRKWCLMLIYCTISTRNENPMFWCGSHQKAPAEHEVLWIRDTSEEFFDQSEMKRSRNHVNEKLMKAKDLCNIKIFEVKERSSFTQHLIATSLFFASKFEEYRKKCPEEGLKETSDPYPFWIWRNFPNDFLL